LHRTAVSRATLLQHILLREALLQRERRCSALLLQERQGCHRRRHRHPTPSAGREPGKAVYPAAMPTCALALVLPAAGSHGRVRRYSTAPQKP
jgi:hypothetical protein